MKFRTSVAVVALSAATPAVVDAAEEPCAEDSAVVAAADEAVLCVGAAEEWVGGLEADVPLAEVLGFPPAPPQGMSTTASTMPATRTAAPISKGTSRRRRPLSGSGTGSAATGSAATGSAATGSAAAAMT